MTGADGGVDPGTQPGWRWDVALSFAGAQRSYVEQVAQALKAGGVRCFYDADEEIDLWGKFLPEELPAIYGEQAAVVVVFVSAEYAARDWTRLERRAALARAVQERREYVLPARFDDTLLAGLLWGMATVDLHGRSPQQFAAMIVEKLAALGIAPAAPSELRELACEVEAPHPPEAIRVGRADPRRLGVHAAINVPEMPNEVPPEYVPRDADAGVRAKVEAAAERGGFVLLVGGSSVGKTRCAVEAVRALLPDWWLVHPAGPGEVAALARAPSLRMVVWLDELQRYLGGEDGLTGGVVRALLNAPLPVVIMATLWPDRYTAYTTLAVPGGADPRAREREVLDLADVVRIGPEFSPAEQDRARAAAARDPRLNIALGAAGYGLTQTLAAAPQLVARWEDAQTASPYAWAVLTAALDAARLGARAPLSADLLRAAAPGYCTSQQLAEAPGNWFEQALAYTTEKLHGATSTLSPAGVGIGQVSGYIAADYLIQHATRERRSARVPASTWDAALSHIRAPADTARVAHSARCRLLYGYAISLYRHATDAGDWFAADQLSELLAERGDVDGAAQILRGRVDFLRRSAADRLARLLAERGDVDGAAQILRAAAAAGDRAAHEQLAELLYEHGDLDRLRAQADVGGGAAADRLARLLYERGDVDGLRARADAGDRFAAPQLLAKMLAQRGDLEGLRARADAGDRFAADQLSELLYERGDVDGLRARAGVEVRYRVAASQLAKLLYERGDLDGLHARADAGDESAYGWLAELLAEHGDLDGAKQILRPRADAGYGYAAERLAELMAQHGDLDGAVQILRARAAAGDRDAAVQVAELLYERSDLDGAKQILRAAAEAGDWAAAERLTPLLYERGDLEELRAQAAAGYPDAALRVAELLAERGDLDGLRARAEAGDGYAAKRLAGLLAERGDLDALRARAETGDGYAAKRLAGLLAERGDLDALRARAEAGDGYAAERLADLLAHQLIKEGRREEAERLRRFGLNPDGSIPYA